MCFGQAALEKKSKGNHMFTTSKVLSYSDRCFCFKYSVNAYLFFCPAEEGIFLVRTGFFA